MKTYSEIKIFLEHILSGKDEVSKFKHLSDDALKSRPSSNLMQSDRYHIHDRPNGDTGMITVHHPKTGNHIASIHYNKVGGKFLRMTEMTKDPDNKDGRVAHEVISHMHDAHGYKFLSSNTLTEAGRRVWEHLAETHSVHAVRHDRSRKKLVAVSKNLPPKSLKKYESKIGGKHEDTEFYLGGKK
jgi:hypothetical protein